MMIKEPLLSIIIPVYNTGKYLKRCIESLEKQTYDNIEVLLIDDGSTDNSGELCDKFADSISYVSVLHKKNAGLGHARNSGIELAKGDYITFLDSDDYINPKMYYDMIKAIRDNNADVAYCDFCFEKTDKSRIYAHSVINAGVYTGMEMLSHIMGAEPTAKSDFNFDMSACKAIFSKQIIEKHGIKFKSEREVICEDLVFQIEYLPYANVAVYIKESYYYYCENVSSLTHRYINNRFNKEKDLYSLVVLLMGDEMTFEQMVNFNRLFLGRVRGCFSQEVKYNKDISFFEKLVRFKEIASDNVVRKVIENYPIYQNPLKLRIFNWCLKKKNCLGMYLLIKING